MLTFLFTLAAIVAATGVVLLVAEAIDRWSDRTPENDPLVAEVVATLDAIDELDAISIDAQYQLLNALQENAHERRT